MWYPQMESFQVLFIQLIKFQNVVSTNGARHGDIDSLDDFSECITSKWKVPLLTDSSEACGVNK